MPKKKLYGAAAKAHAKKTKHKAKKHAKKGPKRSHAKRPAKKKKTATHHRCASCGHKRHPAGACTHFEGSNFCPC